MSKVSIWMPVYIGDYLRDTSRLNTEQHGAFFLLLLDYWVNGPLPDDDLLLANITKLRPEQWRKHRTTLAKYFTIKDGLWKNKRADQEIAAANSRRDAAKENGKKGGRPKKNADNNVTKFKR